MFSIVLPAYNEENSLETYIADIKSELKNKSIINYEILVVNDGSTDKTLEILKKLDIHTVSHNTNKGYGAALKTGISHAKFDTIIISDVDGTYPPKYIPELLEKYNDSKKDNHLGLDMIIGRRTGKFYFGSIYKKFLRKVLKFIVEWTTGSEVLDINSGFRIFSKKTIQKYFFNLSNAFSFSTTSTLSYMLTNKSIDYIEIDYLRREGKSHVKIIRDSLRTIQYVVETILFFNPLKFFLLISASSLLLGLFFITIYLINGAMILKTIFSIFIIFSILSLLFGFLANMLNKIMRKE